MQNETKTNKGQTLEEFLEIYKNKAKDKYEKPSVTVDTLIFTIGEKDIDNYRKNPKKQLQLMMIKRKDHPYINHWAIPGGFVGIKEDIFTSAKRELKEETNIENIYLEQLYTWGDVERDPRMRVISVSYMALVKKEDLDIKAGDDAQDASWFSLDIEMLKETKSLMGSIDAKVTQIIELKLKDSRVNSEYEAYAKLEVKHKIVDGVAEKTIEILETSNLAFDHAKIIYYAWDRLKNKIEYTDIAFHLMPEYFTLSEAQKVYETILKEKLYPANFRRKIEKMVTETDILSTKGKGHRPAKLFKFNPLWMF